MKIWIDGFGGDHAPDEVLKGAADAVREYGVEVTVVGDEKVLRERMGVLGIVQSGLSFCDAPDVVPMEADPAAVLKQYPNSSMVRGLERLRDGEGDAFVSAGSTGALMVASTLVVKRMKGVARAAIATPIPTDAPAGMTLLLDSGANVECRPEMLAGFGIMGSVYMHRIAGVENPRVGLINVGTEETKGTDTLKAAYHLLEAAPVNFVGNVEAREFPLGGCDVAVTDGLVGNVMLKLTEGWGKAFSDMIRSMFKKNGASKLAAMLVKDGLREFKGRLDYTEHGGAPLLGLRRPVIKAHGSSNAKAFKNAIRQAKGFAERDVIVEIESALATLKKVTAEGESGEQDV